MDPTSDRQEQRRYRSIAELGRGGMAEVYLAVIEGQAGFNKLIVLRKTRREFSQEPEFISMFLDEARLAARLSHPNVVQTHEVGQEGEQYYISMEYLDGQPLNKARCFGRGNVKMPTALQLHILAQTLAGLHHAHELADYDGTPLNVVHRDVTPHNVFVTYDGHVKVVDFGIAKAAGAASQTRTGVVKGKMGYMPPEQALGQPVDRRADLFAVGIMAWEAVAGQRMWGDAAEQGVLFRLMQGDIPSLRESTPGVDQEIERIINRALALDPADRYPTAADMQADLEDYLASRNERASARELSKFLTERFAEQRAKIKRTIEEQLNGLRWSGGPASMSRLPLLESPESTLAGQPSSSSRGPSSDEPPIEPAPSSGLYTPGAWDRSQISVPPPAVPTPPAATLPPPQQLYISPPTMQSVRSPLAPPVAAPAAAPAAPAAPADSGKRQMLLGIGIGALAVLAVAGWVIRPAAPGPATAAVSPVPTPSAPVAPAPSPATTDSAAPPPATSAAAPAASAAPAPPTTTASKADTAASKADAQGATKTGAVAKAPPAATKAAPVDELSKMNITRK
jgi:serine/threonine-protein kinase